jgi:signal peptidase I
MGRIQAMARSVAARPSARTVLDWSVFVVVLAGLWLLVGPAQIGGPANYVIVDGTSMEPTYQDGDLVITRVSDAYRVGDVVTYVPHVAGQPFPVIHRVVEVAADGGYVTQGDNRAEVDGWLATDATIVGSSWLHVPHGGTVLMKLREPMPWLIAAIALFTLGILTQIEERRGHAVQEPV